MEALTFVIHLNLKIAKTASFFDLGAFKTMDSTSKSSKTVAQAFINALDTRNFDVLPGMFVDTAGMKAMHDVKHLRDTG